MIKTAISTLPATRLAGSCREEETAENRCFRLFPPFPDNQAALAYTFDKSGQECQVLASWAGQDTLDPGVPGARIQGPRSPGSGVRTAGSRAIQGLQEALDRASRPSQVPPGWPGPASLDLVPIQHLPRMAWRRS